MKNEVKIKQNLPKELFFDLIHFIPFNIKWTKIRISKLFDFFIIKLQRKWIICLNKLREQLLDRIRVVIEGLTELNGGQSVLRLQRVLIFNINMDGIYTSFKEVPTLLISKAAIVNQHIGLAINFFPAFEVTHEGEWGEHIRERYRVKRQVLLRLFVSLQGIIAELNNIDDNVKFEIAMTLGVFDAIWANLESLLLLFRNQNYRMRGAVLDPDIPNY